MSDIVKWLRDQERPGPEACIQERDYCAKMKSAADEIGRLRGLIQAILAADERGQGVNYSEAMNAAAKAISYVS